MGILNWLREVGKPWLGSWFTGEARQELGAERIATRLAGLAGQIRFLPFQESVTGETPAQRKAYRVMFKDPTVKAAILDKVLSVAALDLSVNPGDEGPRDKDAADLGLHVINRTAGGEYGLTGLPAIVESVILPGLIDGFSVCEKVWDVESHGKWSGKAILKWLKAKDTDRDLNLEVDNHNNITAIIGIGINSSNRWPPQAFVIWKHLSVFDNPGGMSDLRAAYKAYWIRDVAWKLRAIHLEKYTSPMLKGTYTDAGTQKAELEEALERAKAATWISVPQGALVEAFEISQKGTADFKAAIDDLNHEIFLGISGAVLQALEGSTTDGRGNSQVHKSTADIRKWHIRACVESVINSQILPDAIDLNMVGVSYPMASLGGVNDSEMQTSLAVDVGLSRDLQLPLSRKDLYKRYGRPEPLDTNDTLEPAAQPGTVPFPGLDGAGTDGAGTPAPNAAPGQAAAPAGDGNVQDAALNGAQIASLLEVITTITSGQVTPEAGRAILGASFPLISAQVLDEIVSTLRVNPQAPQPGVTAAEPGVSGGKPFRASESGAASSYTSWGQYLDAGG